MRYKAIIALAVLIVVVIAFGKLVKPEGFSELLFTFPKMLLLVLLGLSLVIVFLKAWRFFVLNRMASVNVSFLESIKVYVSGQSTTPFPGGEVLRGTLLAKESNSHSSKIAGPIFLQAYTELFSASIFMLFGAFFYKVFLLPAVGIVLLLSLFLYALLSEKVLNTIRSWFQESKKWKGWMDNIEKTHQNIQDSFSDTRLLFKHFLGFNLILAFMSHVIGGFLLYIIATHYGADLSIGKSIFIYTISVLLQGLSITPGGLGITEGGMAGLLVLSHVASNPAFAMVIIFRIVTLLFQTLLGILFLLIFYGKDIFLFSKQKLSSL